MITQTEPKTIGEKWQVTGETLLSTVKMVIHEGNVRRILITQDGQPIAEFPLTVGVVGTLLAPVLAAIGAMSALLTDCTIRVERIDQPVEVGVFETPETGKEAS